MAEGECPATLSGRHSYAQRGTRTGGWFRCLCGDVQDRTAYLARLDRIRIHRLVRCPCDGDIERCDELTARDGLRWQRQRVAVFERLLAEKRWQLEDAMREYRAAEQRLEAERAYAADLGADLLIHQRTSA